MNEDEAPDPTLASCRRMADRRWFATARPDRRPPPFDTDFVRELEALDADDDYGSETKLSPTSPNAE